MDADRFDTVVRTLTERPSRRGMVGLAIGGLLGALSLAETDAKKKKRKKKKKCKGGTKKCGKACIPASNCCSDAACGDGQTCEGGNCACPTGQKDCEGTCVPTSTCCKDCGELGTCDDGECVCLSGSKPCQGSCIPIEDCCSSAECGQHAVCASGTCSCLSGFKECQGSCISLGACCAGEGICGEDSSGGCNCEQASNGNLVCHQDNPQASVATCPECPTGTVCVKQGEGGGGLCYKLCGAS